MSPKQERFYHEYFDQAGNQKKLFPGEELVKRDPEAEDPDEPIITKVAQSNVKVINDYLQARKKWDNLVAAANNASKYAGYGRYTRGERVWSAKLKACDAYRDTFKKAEQAAKDVIYPVVKRLFPDFEIDETEDTPNHHCRTSLGYYTKEVAGHVLLIVKTRDKEDYWNKFQEVVVRDDGIVPPEFSKIFTSNDERNAAHKEYKTRVESANSSGQTSESEDDNKKKIDEKNTISSPKQYDFLMAGVKKSDPKSLKIKLLTRNEIHRFLEKLREENQFVEDPETVMMTIGSIADSDFDEYPDNIAWFETKTAVFRVMPLD